MYNLQDNDPLWTDGLTSQLCFSEYLFEEIRDNRVDAKNRFRSDIISRYSSQILKRWKENNQGQVEQFKLDFQRIYNEIIKVK